MGRAMTEVGIKNLGFVTSSLRRPGRPGGCVNENFDPQTSLSTNVAGRLLTTSPASITMVLRPAAISIYLEAWI